MKHKIQFHFNFLSFYASQPLTKIFCHDDDEVDDRKRQKNFVCVSKSEEQKKVSFLRIFAFNAFRY